MFHTVCPLCGKLRVNASVYATNTEACWFVSANKGFDEIYCQHYDLHFYMHRTISKQTDIVLYNRIINLILEHLIRYRFYVMNAKIRPWHFYYAPDESESRFSSPEYVNLAMKLQEYPVQAIDVAHRTLLNLSVRFPDYSQNIQLDHTRDFRLGFSYNKAPDGLNRVAILPLMEDLGYIKTPNQKNKVHIITALGWQKIDELRKQEQTIQQGFIAMSFHEEANPIRKAFCEAIKQAGYAPMILDEKEHNNQIVPEIFYEIRRSKFVVVDVTYPNYGAYYEAGYAQALDKPVIICCQKQVYENPAKRPHFDIAQQPIIVWENDTELIHRLKNRIEATV